VRASAVGEYHSSLPMLLVTACAHKKWFTFAHDRSERSRRRWPRTSQRSANENCCTKVLVPPEPFGSTRTRPLFAEEASPLYAPSKNEVAQRWQKKVDEFDAFIFTAAEYNRGPTALMHDAMI
jgi:hypothetical protein